MRDMDSNNVAVQGIAPIVMTFALGAQNTGNVNLQGFDGALVELNLGAKHASDTFNSTNKITFLVEHADDDGTGSPGAYASVAAADVIGVTPSSGVVHTVDAVGKLAQIVQFGYVGNKMFLKVTATPAGTIANGLPLAVTVIKGYPRRVPA